VVVAQIAEGVAATAMGTAAMAIEGATARTPLYHLKHMMIDALEKRLIKALKSVHAHGDVAPACCKVW
jgi:hypothetical protein